MISAASGIFIELLFFPVYSQTVFKCLAVSFQNTSEPDIHTQHPKEILCDHCPYPQVQQPFLSETIPRIFVLIDASVYRRWRLGNSNFTGTRSIRKIYWALVCSDVLFGCLSALTSNFCWGCWVYSWVITKDRNDFLIWSTQKLLYHNLMTFCSWPITGIHWTSSR